jgi:hypothetical protein
MGYVITAVVSLIAGGVIVYIYYEYIARKEQAIVNEAKGIAKKL